MTVNRMPEEVIKKALECCSKEGNRCKKCPNNALLTCRERTMEEAYDLINRKNAENEELRSDNETLKQSNINLQELYCNEKEKVNRAREKIIDIAKSLQTKKAEIEKVNKEKENLTETYIQVCNCWQNAIIELQATRNEVMKMKVEIKTARAGAIKNFIGGVKFHTRDNRALYGKNAIHRILDQLAKELGVEL